eukprot:13152800-Heterocapsa_arctica.AAC.1
MSRCPAWSTMRTGASSVIRGCTTSRLRASNTEAYERKAVEVKRWRARSYGRDGLRDRLGDRWGEAA